MISSVSSSEVVEEVSAVVEVAAAEAENNTFNSIWAEEVDLEVSMGASVMISETLVRIHLVEAAEEVKDMVASKKSNNHNMSTFSKTPMFSKSILDQSLSSTEERKYGLYSFMKVTVRRLMNSRKSSPKSLKKCTV